MRNFNAEQLSASALTPAVAPRVSASLRALAKQPLNTGRVRTRHVDISAVRERDAAAKTDPLSHHAVAPSGMAIAWMAAATDAGEFLSADRTLPHNPATVAPAQHHARHRDKA